MVKASCVFLREPNYGAFFSCYLRHDSCQLNILYHPKVGLAGLLGRPDDRRSSYDHPYVPYWGPRSLIISSGVLVLCGWIRFLLTNEFLQFSLSDKGLNLLLEVIAISRIVTMVAVETVILIPGTFVGITLQLSEECQGLLVLDLHKDLIYRDCQWSKARESSS